MNIPSPNVRRRAMTLDVLSILVAAGVGKQSGSEIQSQVIGDTLGDYIIASSLYTILHRLVEMGWLEMDNKHYWLSETGKRRLELELQTLEALSRNARSRL